jgi:hypothetical protein
MKTLEEVKDSIIAQTKCPNCNGSDIRTESATVEYMPKKAGHLIGGLILILIGGICIFIFGLAMSDPFVKEHSNPFTALAIAVLLIFIGFGLINKYFSKIRISQTKCKCKKCNHEWEDKKCGEILTLIDSLTSHEKEVRSKAITTLGNMNNARAVEALIYALNDENSYVKMEVIRGLSKIGTPEAVGHLMDIIEDKRVESTSVKMTAVEGLSKIGTPEAVEHVINSVKYEKEIGFTFSPFPELIKISERGDKKLFNIFIDALKNENDSVRKIAAEALGKIGDERAINDLTNIAANDEEKFVRRAAEKALKKIKETSNTT